MGFLFPLAGGYDALVCLVVNEQVRETVLQFWREYTAMPVVPLSVGMASANRGLTLHHVTAGFGERRED